MSDEDVRTSAGAALDLSSAMVRAESDHLDATLLALVQRLSVVPGLQLAVSYRRGKLRRLIGDLPYINDLQRRTGAVHRIVVATGASSYWLQSEHGSIRCGREITSVERGHEKEELSFAVWATALFDDIAQRNYVNHDSMVALRHLIEHDRVD